MATRYFAIVAGIIYFAVGILGFLPAVREPPPLGAPDLAMDAAHGYLFGIFPVNALHNFVHLGIGLWGIIAYRDYVNSIRFAKGLAIIYGVLTVMGLFPGLNTVFGLVPLHGNDIWLHAVTALIAAYYGWVKEREAVAIDVTEDSFSDRGTPGRRAG